MRITKSDSDGVFTFRMEDAGREVIFLKGQALVANIEEGHCSNHVCFFNGCSDCTAHAILSGAHVEKTLGHGGLKKAFGLEPIEIVPSLPSPNIQLARQQLFNVVRVFFADAAVKVAAAVGKEFKHVAKAGENDILKSALEKLDWDSFSLDLLSVLKQIFSLSSREGLAQLDLAQDADAVKAADSAATAYASARSASIIGKKWVDGKLVDNPAAKMDIAQTTREDLMDLIELAKDNQMSSIDVEDVIREGRIFGASRSQLIAKTETVMGQMKAGLDVWKRSGEIKFVDIVLSDLHVVEDECDEFAAGGPYPIDNMPFMPIHPLCMCSVVARG